MCTPSKIRRGSLNELPRRGYRICGHTFAFRGSKLVSSDLFPEATIDDVQLDDKIAELERELGMRRTLYPKWVASGKLAQHQAHRQIITLEAILEDYRKLWRENL